MMSDVLELAFVLARGQNHFFVELVEALRFELHALGAITTVTTGAFPATAPGRVFVLVPPHEYFALQPRRQHPDNGKLSRTIFISAEQPLSTHFSENVALAPRAGAVFDISARSVAEYHKRGVDAELLQLGHTDRWEDGTRPERDIDVLFLGAVTPRRAAALADYSRSLSELRCRIVLSDNRRPNPGAANNFVVGDEKRQLLRRSKVLLNIHQADEPYFEWLRAVEAMHAGCALVTELSTDHRPLVAGQHFVAGPLVELGSLATALARDEPRREAIAVGAHTYIRDSLPLRFGADRLLSAATLLATNPPAPRLTRVAAARRVRSAISREGSTLLERSRSRVGSAVRYYQNDRASSDLRARAKDLRLEVLDVRRALAQVRCAAAGQISPISSAHISTAYRSRPSPRLSVVTGMFNHASFIEQALGSIAAGEYQDLELVVVDDASTDESAHVLQRWSSAHDDVPLLLLRHSMNQGVAAARNHGVDAARGELVFILDSDNEVYVHCLARLVEALDGDPGADFAYGILAGVRGSRSVRLLSEFPWNVRRLQEGPYIDAMALFRADRMRQLGGYTDDRRLHGWEDYELWCRAADRGLRAAFVPEMLARYRVAADSMIALTDLSHASAFSALDERYPTLMRKAWPGLEFGFYSSITVEMAEKRRREGRLVSAGSRSDIEGHSADPVKPAATGAARPPAG